MTRIQKIVLGAILAAWGYLFLALVARIDTYEEAQRIKSWGITPEPEGE